MPVKDTFPYTARWDSVGLDCSYCTHFHGPADWPDKNRSSFCALHHVSLAVELGKNGYKNGEWFCKDFQDNGDGRLHRPAFEHFISIRDELPSGLLFGFYRSTGFLKEHSFSELPKSA